MLKDLGLAAEAAAHSGAATPMGAKALELYQSFVAQGGAAKDFSGIIEMLRGRA
jgi:3-hydroxyisobutyrate dehydrogenase